MRRFANHLILAVASLALFPSVSLVEAEDSSAPTIRRISLLAGSALELEISASGPVNPQTQVIHNPERLILDFPGATPAKSLRNLDINRGEVKGARVGLFSSKPPVTRIVFDMNASQPYQVFPYGNTVVIKFGVGGPVKAAQVKAAPNENGAEEKPETIISIERPESIPPKKPEAQRQLHPVSFASAPPVPQAAVPQPSVPQPPVTVTFEKGLLSIRSIKANLSEVLAEVHRRTGAEIEIPPAAASEQVFTSIGPAPPKEVLASLLNGSHFNFIVIGSERDPGGIRRVVLTPKQGGIAEAVVYPPCGVAQPAVAQSAPEPGQPAQAFEPPMPPEQADSGEPQAAPAGPPPPQPEQ